MAGYFVLALWFLLVDGVSSADVVTRSVKEGEPVPLHTDVNKLQHDKILWFFNNTRIALINEDNSKSCLYDGEGGRFRDRLKVDYESGSLNITDIRSEHTGHYEAYLIRSMSSGTSQSLNKTSKCDSTKIIRKTSSTDDDIIKTFSVTVIIPDETNKGFYEKRKEQQSDTNSGPSSSVPGSGLSSGAGAGISAGVVGGVLLVAAAAAGVIYYRPRRSREDMKRNNHEVLLNVQERGLYGPPISHHDQIWDYKKTDELNQISKTRSLKDAGRVR